MRVCARYFNVTILDLKSDRRTDNIVRPRQITMYVARMHTLKSLTEIGRRMNRDHTTTLYGVRKIARLSLTDWQIAYDVAMIERELGV